MVALGSFGYFGYYVYQMNRTEEQTDALSNKRQTYGYSTVKSEPITAVTVDKSSGKKEQKQLFVLKQFESLYQKNKNLIGWIKIDGTQIDYPVMKSINGNGEYYLDHNFDQEEDRNGTLFMDDACDVIRPSENWIIYGHNMKSGAMFGGLNKYKSESYYKEHPVVQFDTIYETGIYDVMFAFNSHVYTDAEIAFKYYQFIDPASKQEFDSGMAAMKEMSLYDTGRTAEFGARLLILSTCDYDEENGRFVLVCVRRA